MGTVWAATHQITGGRVALKFLRHGAEPGGDAHRRFLREARSAAQVEHPNVVGVRDVVAHDDMPVIVMDLLQGETLAARLSREGPLPLADVVAIALPLLSAAEAAHAAGLIHRDLKPENVFLAQTPTGEVVRVLDFGVAKSMAIEDMPVSSITESGAVVGTPAYMAPEQLLGERNLDHRVDVWSIGAILYEALVGKRPIDGDNYGQLVKGVLSGIIPRADVARPDLPPDVADLLGHMLRRERADRLSDLHEAATILARHGTMARPSFRAPAPAPSSGTARVVVTRVDPGAPTLQHTPPSHVPSGARGPSREPSGVTDGAVARTGAAPSEAASPWRWVALATTLTALLVVGVQWSRAPAKVGPPAGVSAAPEARPSVASAQGSVASTAQPTTQTAVPTSPSASAAPSTPPSVPVATPSVAAPANAPTLAPPPPATAKPAPSASTVAAPPPPSAPVPSAAPPGPSGGLVTKPPF